jgi:thiosulfate/3-mercaptopyruvate sulfurtransferase
MHPDGSYQILSGRAGFELGHIPGAGFADLTAELSDAASPYRFALPTPEKFAAAMAALGVSDDSRVVLYSATEPAWAARVWWMLKWIGFDRAALLDGGLAAWKAEGRPLSTEPPERTAGRLSVSVRPELIAQQDEVRAAVGDLRVTLVDALPEMSYRGDFALYGRPGHIPGAINLPADELVDETGHYRAGDELAALQRRDPNGRVITYCGGGIAASSTAFVLTRLGYENVAVYVASLQEWVADPANPMEVAPAPAGPNVAE